MSASSRNYGDVSGNDAGGTGGEPEDRRQPLSIRKLAKIYNLSLRTLRFYEDRGLLRPARRGSTRFYTAQDCRRLEIVIKGKSLGFTLTEICDFIDSVKDTVSIQDLARALPPEIIAAQIAHLEAHRGEIDKALADLRESLTGDEAPIASPAPPLIIDETK